MVEWPREPWRPAWARNEQVSPLDSGLPVQAVSAPSAPFHTKSNRRSSLLPSTGPPAGKPPRPQLAVFSCAESLSLISSGGHARRGRLRLLQCGEAFSLASRFVGLAKLLQHACQLIMWARDLRIQFGCLSQSRLRLSPLLGERQRFAQVVPDVRIGRVQFRAPPQIGHGHRIFSACEQRVPQRVDRYRALPRLAQLFLIFADGFVVAPEAEVGEPQMVVSKLDCRIQLQRGFELLDPLYAAIRIQIRSPQQHM